MNIKTEITQEDYVAFLKFVARSVSSTTSERVVRLFVAVAVGLGIGFVLSMVNFSSNPNVLPALLCGALGAASLLMIAISDISRRQMQRMRPVEDGYMLGLQETFLDDEGIRQKSKHHQAIFQWPVVRAIAVTDQHIFVMVDRIAGIILPARAFSSSAERDRFVREIETRSGKVKTI